MTQGQSQFESYQCISVVLKTICPFLGQIVVGGRLSITPLTFRYLTDLIIVCLVDGTNTSQRIRNMLGRDASSRCNQLVIQELSGV